MTTRDAWLYLADLFQNHLKHAQGWGWHVIIGNQWLKQEMPCRGLCAAVDTLRGLEHIDKDQFASMDKVLDDYKENLGKDVILGGFFWPTDHEGAKHRVTFCINQAAKELVV